MTTQSDHKKAVRIALESIRAEIQRLAVDANLCDKFGSDNPSAVNASNRRKELRWASGLLWCRECVRYVEPDEVAEFVEVLDLRAAFDARARAELDAAG